MAKLSAVNKNKKRKNSPLIKVKDAVLIRTDQLSKLPRNSAKTRIMNRCEITGRPHGRLVWHAGDQFVSLSNE